MILGSSIPLLLTIAIKFIAAGDVDSCELDGFKNNATFLPKLSGILYAVQSGSPIGPNEIFNFGPIVKAQINGRTTTDNKCCRTLEVATRTKKDYFDYAIKSDKDCPKPLNEPARLKIIGENTDADKTVCLLVWTCRKSRAGFHVWCTKTKLSEKQQKWILGISKKVLLKKVEQNADYKNGKCFKK